MADEELRFTLAEADIVLRRRQCAMTGHDWTIVMSGGQQDPASVICGRCGRSCAVVGPAAS